MKTTVDFSRSKVVGRYTEEGLWRFKKPTQ